MWRTAVLLDEHPLWLEAVQHVLERVNVEVVGTATTRKDALALVAEHRPDVLLTDRVVGGDGPATLDFISRAIARVPDLRTIVLSAHEDAAAVKEALAAGAVAYVLKTTHPDDLAAAIRQAFDHSMFLASGATRSLIEAPSNGNGNNALTPREREILALAGQGFSNAKIATGLWVTEQTVKFHLSNVYRKLGVTNRTEAARWAQINGLVEDARSAVTAS